MAHACHSDAAAAVASDDDESDLYIKRDLRDRAVIYKYTIARAKYYGFYGGVFVIAHGV